MIHRKVKTSNIKYYESVYKTMTTMLTRMTLFGLGFRHKFHLYLYIFNFELYFFYINNLSFTHFE